MSTRVSHKTRERCDGREINSDLIFLSGKRRSNKEVEAGFFEKFQDTDTTSRQTCLQRLGHV